jgi:hypothetical protein
MGVYNGGQQDLRHRENGIKPSLASELASEVRRRAKLPMSQSVLKEGEDPKDRCIESDIAQRCTCRIMLLFQSSFNG